MIKVSVIVACYNTAHLLPKCLDTLVNQTLDEIEIICIDNASTDNTAEILNSYKQRYPEKIELRRLDVNQNCGGAWNAGVEAARGEYIGFVDSDDWVELDMFETMYAAALDKNADVMECNHCEAQNRSFVAEHRGNGEVINCLLDERAKDDYIPFAYAAIWERIYKRELLLDNNIRFLPNFHFVDNIWTPLVIAHTKSLYKINKTMYYYYKHPDSGTRVKDTEIHYDLLNMSIAILDEAKAYGVYERYKKVFDVKFVIFYYLWSLYVLMDRLSDIRLDKLYEIRLYIKKQMPYYREIICLARRKLYYSSYLAGATCKLMDSDPRLAFIYAKTLRSTT